LFYIQKLNNNVIRSLRQSSRF